MVPSATTRSPRLQQLLLFARRPPGGAGEASRGVRRVAVVVRQRSSTEFAENRALWLKVALFPVFVLFFSAVAASLVVRPQLTTGTLLWLTLVGFFLSSEQSSNLHASQKTENKFWILMSSVYSALLLLARDSPLKMQQQQQTQTQQSQPTSNSSSSSLATILVLACFPYFVHLWHKLSHRRYLENRRFPLVVSASVSSEEHSAESLLKQVNTALATLDSAFVPGGVRRIFDRSLMLQTNEERVLCAFRDASAAELNLLVHHVNMNVCLYRIKNRHHAASSVSLPAHNNNNKTLVGALYGMGGEEEEEEGTVMSTSEEEEEEAALPSWRRDLAHRNNRNALMELLAEERLDELNVDGRAALLDAIQVVGLIRNPLTRDRATQWTCNLVLRTTGADLVRLKQMMDSKGSIHSLHKLVYNDVQDARSRQLLLDHFLAQSTSYSSLRVRKVLSDVDDTFISSGGQYPAGMDDTYPHHAIYPGASAFYSALGQGGNLAFLSARPHVYKDVAESRVYSKFDRLIKSNKLHTMPTLLPGCLDSGQAYMLRGDFEPMAQKKLRNMMEYYSLYPEAKLVFIGDNGQADVRAAELMVDRLGDHVMECVFIHQVQPLDRSFGYSQLESVKWGKFCFYRTLVGAAAFAYKRGMISSQALHHCMTTARAEFAGLISQKFPRGVLGVEMRRQELAQDFALANALLEGVSGMVVVLPPPALCMYAPGTIVYTRLFGRGVVTEFRAEDGMYRVRLLDGQAWGSFTLLDLASFAWDNAQGEGLHLGVRSATEDGDGGDVAFGIPVGSEVRTKFGEGVVRRYRAHDRVFEVMLTKWPAIAFLQPDQVSLVKVSTKEKLLGYGRAFLKWRFAPGGMATSRRGGGGARSPLLQVGSKVFVHPLGEAVVLHWREEDSIAHLRFASFDTYTHVSSIALRPLKTPHVLPVSPKSTSEQQPLMMGDTGGSGRGRTMSLEAMLLGAKQKVVAKLFSSPKSSQLVLIGGGAVLPNALGETTTTTTSVKAGDRVRVDPFGEGVVRRVRAADEEEGVVMMAEVEMGSRMMCYAPVTNCRVVVVVSKASSSPSVAASISPRSASLYEKTRTALQQWVSFDDRHQPQPMPKPEPAAPPPLPSPLPPITAITTTRVKTAYGSGTMQQPIEEGGEGGMCEVKLDWGATAYLQQTAVVAAAATPRVPRHRLFSAMSSSPLQQQHQHTAVAGSPKTKLFVVALPEGCSSLSCSPGVAVPVGLDDDEDDDDV